MAHNDRFLRFALRVWDPEKRKMIEPVSLYYFEEQAICDTDEIAYEADGGDVLMQCVGMRDSAGRPMYEGDIVHRDGMTGVVRHDGTGFAVDFKGMRLFQIHRRGGFTVVGNVFETPDRVPQAMIDAWVADYLGQQPAAPTPPRLSNWT